MVSKIDIEHVARFLFSPEKQSRALNSDLPEAKEQIQRIFLIEIDPLRISTIDARKIPLLEDMEYFGYVPEAAILSRKEISFELLPLDISIAMPKAAPPMLKVTYERTANLKLVIKP